MPRCWGGISNSLSVDAAWSRVERITGFAIEKEDSIRESLDDAFGAWAVMEVLSAVEPCYMTTHRRWYCVRDVLEALYPFPPKLFWCYAGGHWTTRGTPRIESTLTEEGYGVFVRRIVKYCYKCGHSGLKRKERETWLAQQRYESIKARETEELATMGCKLQVKALRDYLKNGNPEVLLSLPEGFRPASSSQGA